MKSRITLSLAVAILSVAMIACQSSGTKEKKVATLDSSRLDAKKLKDEIVDIIMALPDNQETVNLINETGAAYIGGLTLEDVETNNLLTRAASAKTYGGVLFDMAYANTYNQVNTFSKLLAVNESLVRKLGFEDFLAEQKAYQDRYLANKDNRDSVDHIVAELLNSSNQYIQKHGSATDISLVFAGATTKSLFVMASVTLFAMNNDKLVDLMKKQKDRIAAAYNILTMTGEDAEVQKMAEAIKPIMDIYAAESFSIDSVDKIREMTSFVME